MKEESVGFLFNVASRRRRRARRPVAPVAAPTGLAEFAAEAAAKAQQSGVATKERPAACGVARQGN